MFLVDEVDRLPSPGHSHRWTSEHKVAARNAVNRAIKAGMLVPKEDCERCGRHRSERRRLDADHYLGYDEEHWLDVLWLCRSCHGKEHNHPEELAERMRETQARITPDQRRVIKRTYTDEGRRRISEAVSAAWARRSCDELSEIARQREANLTDEQREARRQRGRDRAAELNRKRWEGKTPEERRATALHARAHLSKEELSAIGRKGGLSSRMIQSREKGEGR